MNNVSANNAPAIIRSLIMYSVCVPLAVFVGYLLTNPLDYSTLGVFGTLALVLVLPLLLRWHHPLLLLSWNASAVMFFLKGSPSLFMVMVALSLTISVLERILSPDKRFIHVPQLTSSLIFMLAVVLFTAKLTGGFGFRALGSEVYGGRKYLFTIIGILSYFALTARKIPPQHAKWALILFFFGGFTNVIGDLFTVLPSWCHPLFWIFPPNALYQNVEIGTTRFASAGALSGAVVFYMLARYGIRGVFNFDRPFRLALFFLFLAFGALGGFRSYYMTVGGIFLIQFYLEGMQRTRLLPIFAFCVVLAMVLIVPLASKLPFTVQRSLAFLPLNWSQEVQYSANTTVDWRLDMWKGFLPQIPKHLLLGKGYAISMEDFQNMGTDSAFHSVDPTQSGLAVSSDYHNGWIAVLMTFGIWGMIAFLWFAAASFHVLYQNYRHGDPNLLTVNSYLLANFTVRFLWFMSYGGGGLHSDMSIFVGCVGLGIVLNGGVCQPAPEPAQKKSMADLVRPSFPRPRPIFQR